MEGRAIQIRGAESQKNGLKPKIPTELSNTEISIKSERSVDFALGFGRWV